MSIDSWLNYHHLRYFAAVIEEGSLTGAARRLNVSHPTVSEQIHKLEAHLELDLFERRGRRLRPTEVGEMVYDYAAQIFGVGAALLAAVEGRRSGRSVIGRVGVDSVLAKLTVRRLLSPVMDHLGEALRLRCTEDEREPLLAELRSRQLDVVFSDAPTRPTSRGQVTSHLIATSGLTFFASPDLVCRIGEDFPACLDQAPFLLPMTNTRLRRELERWLGERRVRPRVAAEIEDSGLLKAFGQEGRGVFAMPTDVRDDVCDQYQVIALGEAGDVETRVFAITRGEDSGSTFVRNLLELHEADR